MKKVIVGNDDHIVLFKKVLCLLLSLVMLVSVITGFDLTAYADTSGDYKYETLYNGNIKITKYNGSDSIVFIPSTIDGGKVTSIGDFAFNNCTSLTSVTIDNSVTNIGGYAFYYCNSLTSVTIGNSVTSIGDFAFNGCTSLTNVTIGNSVTSIGQEAFDNTALYNDNTNWENNVLYIGKYLIKAKDSISGDYSIKDGTMLIPSVAFYNCRNLTSVTIPDGVTSIGNFAFQYCTSLTSVTIPDSVTSIGRYAFENCSSLTSVTIPNSVTSIGRNIFSSCSSLTSVTIGDSVRMIDVYTFGYCRNLTSVTIGNSVRRIDEDAFISCASLTDVYYVGSEEQWNQIVICDGNRYLTNATIHYNATACDIAGGHTYNSGTVTQPATCTATGIKTYTCTVCGDAYTETIAKKAHTYKTTTTKATLSKNGSVVTKCSVCGNVSKSTTIYYPKTITFSATSYVYDGKVKKPSVTVKDSKGKTIAASNYTVTYASGRKIVGQYSVKITFKGNYSGSKTLYFTINPKATTLSSVTAKSKGFTVKWKKQATQTTGYQIQYSTSSKFTNAKTVTVSKNSTTSKTISKLTAKKKYYVRIRTYKTVNGKNYYSSWSAAKTVTTKK